MSVIVIVIGAVLAAISAPTWSYPFTLIGFLVGVRAYLRRGA